MDDLAKLINRIYEVSHQNRMNVVLKEEIDQLIASALEEIGIRQIMDTGQARSIFIDIAREYLGVELSHILDEPTNKWGNLERGRDTYNFRPYTVRLENSLGRFMEFGIEDEGVSGQEDGTFKANRDDGYKMNHVTTAMELAESGNLVKFEKYVELIQEKIVDYIEGW